MKSFVTFKQGLDSAAAEDYKYKDYIDGLTRTSFSRHKIGVFSSDRFIFRELKRNLGHVLVDNDYLKTVNKTTLDNYDKNIKTLEKQEQKIDSLLTVYLSIRERESKKELTPGTSGTNFFMGNQQPNTLIVDETALLSTKLNIAEERRGLDLNKVTGKNLVNIISDFPDAGYDHSKWYNKMKIVFPIIFFCVTFFGFLLLGLSQYLSEQEKLMES